MVSILVPSSSCMTGFFIFVVCKIRGIYMEMGCHPVRWDVPTQAHSLTHTFTHTHIHTFFHAYIHSLTHTYTLCWACKFSRRNADSSVHPSNVLVSENSVKKKGCRNESQQLDPECFCIICSPYSFFTSVFCYPDFTFFLWLVIFVAVYLHNRRDGCSNRLVEKSIFYRTLPKH